MEMERYVPATQTTQLVYPQPPVPQEVLDLIYLTQEELLTAINATKPRTDSTLLEEAAQFSQKYSSMQLVR